MGHGKTQKRPILTDPWPSVASVFFRVRLYQDSAATPISACEGRERHTAGRQHLLRCADAVVERLLEQGDTAEVGVREVDAAVRSRGRPAGAAPDEAGLRPDHGMAP